MDEDVFFVGLGAVGDLVDTTGILLSSGLAKAGAIVGEVLEIFGLAVINTLALVGVLGVGVGFLVVGVGCGGATVVDSTVGTLDASLQVSSRALVTPLYQRHTKRRDEGRGR
jgi:hypothetical protein